MRSCGLAGFLLAFFVQSAWAAPTTSIRPAHRTDLPTGPLLAESTVPQVSRTIRPGLRPDFLADRPAPNPGAIPTALPGFHIWIAGFKQKAVAQGISQETVDAAFLNVVYDQDIIKRDRNQAEFSKAIWDYLDTAVSDLRVRNGRTALTRYESTLREVEATYGVDKEIVVAIWGLESAYGSFRGSNKIMQSLATLAYDGRRAAFFEAQLIAALEILDAGDTIPSNMTGSWAGAMGHTQFMPTSYLEHAVDFTGDGRRDIWSDDPTDALASTANYLKAFGWTKDQPWGVEVQLPTGFDYALADRKIKKQPMTWARLGIVDMAGQPVRERAEASILLPAGAQGPAFMIFDNFAVIERYNAADAYVIGVGHLADRIAGQDGFQRSWPRADRTLSFSERKELQLRLTAAGYNTYGIDGRIGPKTIGAVRAYQQSNGLEPDGYASARLLDRLR